MLWVYIRMKKHDCKRFDSFIGHFLKGLADIISVWGTERNNLFSCDSCDAFPNPCLWPIERVLGLAGLQGLRILLQHCYLAFTLVLVKEIGQHDPFVDLNYLFIQYLWRLASEIKYVASGLIPNLQQITKALRYDKPHTLSFPFQQRIGSYRSSHPNTSNRRCIHHLSAGIFLSRKIALVQNTANALGGSIVVVGRIDGKKLRDDLRAIGKRAVHIGEGASAVDGEMELPIAVFRGRCHLERRFGTTIEMAWLELMAGDGPFGGYHWRGIDVMLG
mmetsp:Transcript_20969/g.50514  ORF Transcript_20969/g.50514 Transcript_20969/m.50514 type:complete len:275 (-) Transcript_20969:259-1083(-)